MADPHKRFNSIIEKLRDNHHKLTPQRMAIVKILAHRSRKKLNRLNEFVMDIKTHTISGLSAISTTTFPQLGLTKK